MSAPLPASLHRDRVETVLRLGLARHAPGADVIAEGRRIADRRALVAADQVQPGERPAREILGLHVIGRHLVGDDRQEAADQAHVVIPGQPADAAVALLHLHAMAVRRQVAQQRMVRHRYAMGEAGRTARILQIGDLFGLRLRQVARGRVAGDEILERDALDAFLPPGLARHILQFLGKEEQHRVAAGQLDVELVDIAFLAAKAGGQRQRHRPGAGIDDAEEKHREVRARFRHQRDPVLRLDAMGDQPMGAGDRVGAQFAERIGPRQIAPRVVEIQAPLTLRRIVQRLAQRPEIGEAARQIVSGRRRCHHLLRTRHIGFTQCHKKRESAAASSFGHRLHRIVAFQPCFLADKAR